MHEADDDGEREAEGRGEYGIGGHRPRRRVREPAPARRPHRPGDGQEISHVVPPTPCSRHSTTGAADWFLETCVKLRAGPITRARARIRAAHALRGSVRSLHRCVRVSRAAMQLNGDAPPAGRARCSGASGTALSSSDPRRAAPGGLRTFGRSMGRGAAMSIMLINLVA